MSTPMGFNVTAHDGASAVFGKVEESAGGMESGVGKASGALSKFGDLIGGEVGEVLAKFGEGLEQVGEAGQSYGAKFMAVGGVTAGVGVAMQAMASKGQAAEGQLRASITNLGDSFDDYEGKIKSTVKANENFGYSTAETDNALQKLTDATKDPNQAIERMGLVTDLAASKHISLDAAAGMVAKTLGGNTKLLKSYGIQMGDSGDKTVDADRALDHLAQRLNGQAAAATDNFGGKVDAIKTKIGDVAEEIAAKAGPAITTFGGIVGGVGAILETGILQKTGKWISGLGVVESALGKTKSMLGLEVAAMEESTAAIEQNSAAIEQNVAAVASQAEIDATAAAGAVGASISDSADDASNALGSLTDSMDQFLTVNDTLGAVQEKFAAGEEESAVATETHTAASEQITAALDAESTAATESATTTNANTVAHTDSIVATDNATISIEANTAALAENAAASEASGAAAATAGAERAAAGAEGAAGGGMSMLGPIGLAVGAAIGIATFAMSKMNDQAAETEEQVKSLTAALDADSGSVGANTQQTIANNLESSGAADLAAKFGLTLDDVTGAVLGNADAQSKLDGVTKGLSDKQPIFATRASQVSGSMEDQENNAAKLRSTVDDLKNSTQDAIEKQKSEAAMQAQVNQFLQDGALKGVTMKDTFEGLASQYNLTTAQAKGYVEMLGLTINADGSVQASVMETASALASVKQAMAVGTSTELDYVAALDKFAASAGTAADKAALIGSTLKDAQGDNLGYANAMAASNQTVIDFDAAVGKLDSKVVSANGSINLQAGGAATLTSQLQALQTQAQTLAGVTYQHEVATRGDAAAAADAQAAFNSLTTGALMNNYKQLGLTETQARGLASTYFAMPDNVSTIVQQEGSEQAKAEVSDLYDFLQAKIAGHTFVGHISITGAAAAAAAAANLAHIDAHEGRAVGGDLTPGVTNVGEFGREQVTWAGPGSTPHVVANAQARTAALAAGGDTYVHVTVQGNVAAVGDLATEIGEILDDRNYRNGRQPVFGGRRG